MKMDTSEFKDVFEAEARDYLQALNQDLLQLENNPDDSSVLNEMFRAAHSLKGMSSTMGYHELADFTHQMESVLDLLRVGELTATEEINNILFKTIDILELLLNKTLLNQELPDISHMVNQLNVIIKNKGKYIDHTDIEISAPSSQSGQSNLATISLDEYDLETIAQARIESFDALEIYIRLRPKTLLKSVRVYTVFQALEQVGTIIKCKPSAEELENERFDREFALILLTQEDKSIIEKLINNISEIESVIVSEINPEHKKETEGRIVKPLETRENLPKSTTAASSAVKQRTTPLQSKGVFADKFTRVETERLDNLINLVGELVISKTQVMEINTTNSTEHVKNALVQLDRITTELQYAAMKLRMVPIKQVFGRFPRLVRDLAQAHNKDINLEIIGEETELDRSLVNKIGDPLVHLIRNSIDHGIETKEQRKSLGKPPQATIRISAYHEGSHVLIKVADDGQGLDVESIKRTAIERGLLPSNYNAIFTVNEAINMIFEPGFSTNDYVTDISGRGVGMDIVKNIVESLSGQIEIDSKSAQGLCVTIKLPLTLAIIKALLVKCKNQTYAIPIQAVKESLLVNSNQIKTVSQQQVIVLRNEVLPLIDLAEFLGFAPSSHGDVLSVIVIESQGVKIGFIIDDLIGQQEIVIKSLTDVLGDVYGISGATVLGDGQVALILDHSILTKGRSESIG